ncbi:MAG: tyrosine-type recombinase/integrase, partial [Candidatus Eiseniibacteriota bacterium]
MARQRTLLLEETFIQPKVIKFLDAKERRSLSTRRVYSIALAQFQTFLFKKHEGQTLESILQPLVKKKINVYELLDEFVQYLYNLNDGHKLSPKSIRDYAAGISAYLQRYDIDIVPAKFKNQVTLPNNPRRDEEAIDASDIRKILKACNNRRLKAFLLVLASSGLRSMEAITLRNIDFNFDSKPTRVHVRPEFAKTRVERYVWISEEATEAVRQWLEFKYRVRVVKSDTPKKLPN